MNEYYIIKEISYNEGKKEIWYNVTRDLTLTEKIASWLPPWLFLRKEYNPYQNKQDAIRGCKLRNEDKWDGHISSELIPVSQKDGNRKREV